MWPLSSQALTLVPLLSPQTHIQITLHTGSSITRAVMFLLREGMNLDSDLRALQTLP